MVRNLALKNINVYLGRHLRSSGGKKYGVSKATYHPGWEDISAAGSSDELAPFDLLLLRLDRAVTFSATVSPVCLPNVVEDSPSPGRMVILVISVMTVQVQVQRSWLQDGETLSHWMETRKNA